MKYYPLSTVCYLNDTLTVLKDETGSTQINATIDHQHLKPKGQRDWKENDVAPCRVLHKSPHRSPLSSQSPPHHQGSCSSADRKPGTNKNK